MNERNEYRLHAIYQFIQHTVNSTNQTSEKEREMLFQTLQLEISTRHVKLKEQSCTAVSIVVT